MAVTPAIAVSNESTAVGDAEVQACLPAWQHQIGYHFRPFWNAYGRLLWFPDGKVVPPQAWHLAILDDSDQAGALGYHDVTVAGTPLLKVFAGTDIQYGLSWSVTATHEILEALADPDVSRGEQVDAKRWFALEVGDPVEADDLAYHVPNGKGQQVLCSDFILPAWFHPEWQGVIKYDYMGHCKQALQILQGGYMSVYVSGRGWVQLENFQGEQREQVWPEEPGGKRPRPSQEIRRQLRQGNTPHA